MTTYTIEDLDISNLSDDELENKLSELKLIKRVLNAQLDDTIVEILQEQKLRQIREDKELMSWIRKRL